MNNESYQNNYYELAKVILFYANSIKSNLYKTKLNKLLFYTQFIFFKEYKTKLFDNEFIVDYHGPVIDDMNNVLNVLSEKKIIDLTKTRFGTVIIPLIKMEDSQYDEAELNILKRVYEKFKDYTSAEISEYSHEERVWSKDSLKQVIPLERAIEINDL